MNEQPDSACWLVVNPPGRRWCYPASTASPPACLIGGEPAECPSPFRFTAEACAVDLLASAHDL